MNTTAIRSLPSEFWAALAALATGAVFLAKKIFRRSHPRPEPVTRAEFHAAMDATRDRIGASYLALADKLDSHRRDLLLAIERQGATFENRLDQLESNFARLDERTSSRVVADARSL